MTPDRAWVLLKSGRRLDLLDPHPHAWTDEDMAAGLARTYRWGGHSKWHRQLGYRPACEMRLSRVGGRDDDTRLPELCRLPLPG